MGKNGFQCSKTYFVIRCPNPEDNSRHYVSSVLLAGWERSFSHFFLMDGCFCGITPNLLYVLILACLPGGDVALVNIQVLFLMAGWLSSFSQAINLCQLQLLSLLPLSASTSSLPGILTLNYKWDKHMSNQTTEI